MRCSPSAPALPRRRRKTGMLRQEIHEIEGFRLEVTRNETRRSPDGRLAPGVTVIVAEPTAGGPDRLPRPLLVEHYPAPGCTITSYDEQAHLVGVQFACAEGGVWQSWLAP